MTVPDIVSGRVVNISVDETQLDLIEDESFSWTSNEDSFEFDPASETTTQRIPGRNAPEFEFESRIDKVELSGLEALGVIDTDGNYQYDAERQVDSITVEFLDSDDGTVELTFDYDGCNVLFDNVDDDNPLMYSITVEVNGGLQITNGTT